MSFMKMQEPKNLNPIPLLSQAQLQGVVSEVELPGLQPAPVWDVCATNSGFTCYTTTPAPYADLFFNSHNLILGYSLPSKNSQML